MFGRQLLSLLLISFGVFIGCVSVKLPTDGTTTKSAEVKFKAPAAPFMAMRTTGADSAWQNSSNGNSIGYYSACNPDGVDDLELIQKDLETEFREIKILSRDKRRYNQREGLFSKVEGQIEGVPTLLSSVVFRKNGCNYSLTYLGVKKSFDSNKALFDEFVQSFSAP